MLYLSLNDRTQALDRPLLQESCLRRAQSFLALLHPLRIRHIKPPSSLSGRSLDDKGNIEKGSRWCDRTGSHILRFRRRHQPHGFPLLSWILKRAFRRQEEKPSADHSGQDRRYIDEKRAKAIKQAALFEESRGAKGAPQCPRCGAEMTLQLARQGDRSGSRFWGCTEYPACKATRKA
jgi:hypothetical protein